MVSHVHWILRGHDPNNEDLLLYDAHSWAFTTSSCFPKLMLMSIC